MAMVSPTWSEVVAADYREVGCTRICQTRNRQRLACGHLTYIHINHCTGRQLQLRPMILPNVIAQDYYC